MGDGITRRDAIKGLAALGAAGNGGNPLSATTGGEDSKGLLAYRIRSLQKRAARVATDGGK